MQLRVEAFESSRLGGAGEWRGGLVGTIFRLLADCLSVFARSFSPHTEESTRPSGGGRAFYRITARPAYRYRLEGGDCASTGRCLVWRLGWRGVVIAAEIRGSSGLRSPAADLARRAAEIYGRG